MLWAANTDDAKNATQRGVPSVGSSRRKILRRADEPTTLLRYTSLTASINSLSASTGDSWSLVSSNSAIASERGLTTRWIFSSVAFAMNLVKRILFQRRYSWGRAPLGYWASRPLYAEISSRTRSLSSRTDFICSIALRRPSTGGEGSSESTVGCARFMPFSSDSANSEVLFDVRSDVSSQGLLSDGNDGAISTVG